MIRQFRPEDALACSTLIQACTVLDSQIPAGLRQVLLRQESPEAMRERANLFYVAVCLLDGAIVGLGGLDLNEVRLLYVAPEQQGRGIGRSLLAHLETMVPSDLFSDIFVYALPSATGFYRLQGYEFGGGHTVDVDDQALETIFMTKSTR